MALILSGLFGVLLSAIGGWMIASPFTAEQVFGIDPSHMADIALMPAIGARQLALGLIVLLLALRQKAGALGTVLLIGSLVPIADFVIAGKAFGYAAAIRHLVTLPFFVGLGAVLARK
jgi:hypothetical protein